MCGIVGYIGNKKAQPILLSGLKRLEYRGYDSAGIITLDDADATLIRKKGKVSELDELLSKNSNSDSIGIGHTRWATHGIPSIKNAHPHKAGSVYLVHNGIIENYQDLKVILAKRGVKFASDTDSEVLGWLIDTYIEDGASLEDAVAAALRKATGTYGIAVLSTKDPRKIVIARNGSPLIVGLGDDEIFIASDASALIGHTRQAVYLNDGEMAVCGSGFELYDLNQKPLKHQIEELDLDMQKIQKQGYKHFLLKEIMEQPETLQSTLRGRVNSKQGYVKLGGPNLSDAELRNIKNILIVGCGTAYYAGMMASYMLEKFLDDVHVEVAIASELRYRNANITAGTVGLIVSQSGETADSLACLRELKKQGIKTLGIVNAVGSTIAREVDGGIYLHVGPEISVASTKAFTSQVAAMLMFGLIIAQSKGVDPQVINEIVTELEKLPDKIKETLKHHGKIKKLAKKLYKYDHAFYLGRDQLYPIAMEGAIKLKEISYIHAEGYPAGELKHGPIALIDKKFFIVFLILDNWLTDKSISNLEEVHARGGNTLLISNLDKNLNAKFNLRIHSNLEWLTPLLINVVSQLLAYEIAVARDTDVDQPRNLAKSVTVE